MTRFANMAAAGLAQTRLSLISGRLEVSLPGIEDTLVRMAYERLRASVAMTMLAVLAFAAFVWPFFPGTGRYYWVAALLLTSLARYGLYLAHKRARPGPNYARYWGIWHNTLALLAGAAWAVGPALMLPSAGRTETLLLILPLLAVSAVAVATMSAQIAGLYCFVGAALLPTAQILLTTGGAVERLAAAVVIASMLAFMIVGYQSARATRSLLDTEYRLSQATANAEAARVHAENASQAKTRFLANMSHELRTPLNAVIGAAQLLRAQGDSPAQRDQLLDAIERSGQNLLGLIENILDLSRIEAGELVLAPEDFNLVDCLDAVLVTAGVSARAKGLTLIATVDADVPAWRHGARDRLNQVLLNLLGNALKFTAQGEIRVHVRAGSDADHVRFEVADSGVGIAESALPHIFEPFRQGEEGSNRRYGGSGLGLTIVHEVVQAMGGEIRVTSTPGAGSCFAFAVPLRRVATPATEARLSGLAVAYFEPHARYAQALDAILRRLGASAQAIADGAQLQAWLAQQDPRPAVLLDLDLPPHGQLLEALKPLAEAGRMIGMSCHENPGPGARAALATLAIPVAKLPILLRPLGQAALLARLEPCLQVGPVQTLAHQTSPRHAAPDEPVHVLVVEDDPLNLEIVSRTLRHAGYLVVGAPDGQAALDAWGEQAFDVVLMDWQMPDMDGLEVTRRMRAGEAGSLAAIVPIIALTANAFAEDRAACLDAGMNDFLSKPVNAPSLYASLQRWAARPERPVANPS